MSAASKSTTRSCVFCGSPGPLTREHAISKHVASQLGIVRMGEMSKGAGGGTLVRPMPSVDITVRAVCASCNGGWMSDLEMEFVRVAGAALVGQPVLLSPADQAIGARWATKTAFMLNMATTFATSGDPVAERQLHTLYTSGDPAPGTTVWMAGIDAGGTLVSWLYPTTFSVAGEPIGYQVAFSVGYALFAITGWDAPDNVGATSLRINPAMSNYFIEIWPTGAGPIAWPPPQHLSQADLDTVWPSGRLSGEGSV